MSLGRLLSWFAVLGILTACGGGGSSAPSRAQRCQTACMRFNADADCMSTLTCSSFCGTYLAAESRCAVAIDALFTCYEGTADLCVAGAPNSCESQALEANACRDAGADAGP